MHTIIKYSIIFGLIIYFNGYIFAQARIDINNNSSRKMTVKVMRNDGFNGELFEQVYISPYELKSVYFSQTGYYFTKTKAEKPGKDPVYRKGELFKVYNGDDGYSVLTLTFTIKESSTPIISGGKSITKKEFDQD